MDSWVWGARTEHCPHLRHVTVFVCVVCEVKVERVPVSLLVVFPGIDVDVYGRRACVSVFVGVLRWGKL